VIFWYNPNHMNEENLQRLEARLESYEKKIDDIYVSVKKMQLYFKWTFIITVVLFVLPLIGLMVVIPTFLKNITSSLSAF